MVGGQFRSTGSYEPDRAAPLAPPALRSFDPQALTSLTLNLPADLPQEISFDPQALTSLTKKTN